LFLLIAIRIQPMCAIEENDIINFVALIFIWDNVPIAIDRIAIVVNIL